MTADGYPLTPGITIPTDAELVTIGADGTVSALVPGDNTPQALGTLQLVRFSNQAGLDARLGRNLLLETQASGAPNAGQPGLDGCRYGGTRFSGKFECGGGGGNIADDHCAACV